MQQTLLKRGSFIVCSRDGEFCLINSETGRWLIVNKTAKNVVDFVKRPLEEKEIIDHFSKKGLNRNRIKKYIAHLISSGILYPANKKIKRNKNQTLIRLPYLFVLSTTNGCNLSCKYCYANSINKNYVYMSLEVMKKTIDIAVSMPQKLIGVEFHGGEPLLRFDIIKEAVLYGEKMANLHNKELKFLIQTNGTLLNEDIAHFIKKHNIDLGISLDGPKRINDRNRVFSDGRGSYGRIMKNISMLQKMNVKFGILAVIEDWKEINRIFTFYSQKNINSVKLNFIFPQGRAILQKQDIDEVRASCEFLKIVDRLIKLCNRQKEKIKEANIGFILENIISPNSEDRYMCLNSPCGAMLDMVAVDKDGSILPCEKMVGIDYFKKYYTIGNVKSINNFQKVVLTSKIRTTLLDRNVDAIDDCKSCTWKRFCSGGCLVDAYLINGDINSKGLYCKFYKTILEKMLWKIKDESTTLLKLFDLELID